MLDVVVSDVQMRHGAEHRRMDRRGETDTGLVQTLQRIRLGEPKWRDVELDEVDAEAAALAR